MRLFSGKRIPPVAGVVRGVTGAGRSGRALGVLFGAVCFMFFQGCSEKNSSRIPLLSLPPSTAFRILQPVPALPRTVQDSKHKKPPYIGLLFSLARPRPGVVVAVGAQSVIWRIRESSGQSIQIRPPVKSEFYKVIFTDPGHGWIVGDGGTILFSPDGGKNWAVVPSPVKGKFLQDIYFADAQVGFAAGEKGTFLKTEDGGKTWFKLPVPTSENLYGVYFLNRRDGWLAGWHQTFLVTHDGGKTWSPVSLSVPRVTRQQPSFNTLWGNDGDILLAGDHGLVYLSTDKGHTFRRIAMPAERDLYGACRTGTGRLILAGEGGTLWSLEEGDRVREVLPPVPEADFLGVSCGQTHIRATGPPGVILLPKNPQKAPAKN
ncbi:MAG: WD40/YVTN/BNR-like repeat-containing protein [Leptospirillum sp.]